MSDSAHTRKLKAMLFHMALRGAEIKEDVAGDLSFIYNKPLRTSRAPKLDADTVERAAREGLIRAFPLTFLTVRYVITEHGRKEANAVLLGRLEARVFAYVRKHGKYSERQIAVLNRVSERIGHGTQYELVDNRESLIMRGPLWVY